MTTVPGVYSEIGKLRTVLVHRPGVALDRLTPANRGDYLFDDVVWVERAQREHDAFVELMRSRGVEVLYLQELLAEALAHSADARTEAITGAVSAYSVGVALVAELRAHLAALSPARLAEILLGGLLVSELDGLDLEELSRHSLGAVLAEPESFVLPPLPNSLFTRDSSAWLYGGGTPILHVIGGRPSAELVKGVIDHMAFTAHDLRAVVAKLADRGIAYELRRLPAYGTWQLFFMDPNGAKVELDFDAAEPAPAE